MANPKVEQITGFYGSLAERWLDRWSRIVNEGRAGTYTANSWAEDAAGTLSDVTSSIRFAADFIDPLEHIVDLPMTITPGQTQVVAAAAIVAPGVALQAAALRASDDIAVQIPSDKVQVWVTSDNILVVRLRQMTQDPPLSDLTPGREFTADIHAENDAGDVKARIVLTVAAP